MSDSDARRASAQAMAAFLAWPGPVVCGSARLGVRTHALAGVMAAVIGCALAVISLAFGLAATAAGPWAGGAHLLLFCHLTL
jgi:hypothetical protein